LESFAGLVEPAEAAEFCFESARGSPASVPANAPEAARSAVTQNQQNQLPSFIELPSENSKLLSQAFVVP
jgi:hypothetical protein